MPKKKKETKIIKTEKTEHSGVAATRPSVENPIILEEDKKTVAKVKVVKKTKAKEKKVIEKSVKLPKVKKVKEELPKALKPAMYFAVGRRKTAVARIRLYSGLPKEENIILINDKPIEKYFSSEIAKKAYIEPFRTTNTIGRFKVTVKVEGSGQSGQLDACILGFSRAIEQVDKDKFRPILKKRGLLTRDDRTRQRRMIGTGGKARRQKQSPKR